MFLRRRLPLVGPNYHVRSKPRYLRDAISLPDFPRLGDSFNEIELMVQVPPNVSAYDEHGQLDLFRRGIRQVLRYQQFRDFESFVDSLGHPNDRRRTNTSPELPQVPPTQLELQRKVERFREAIELALMTLVA